MFFIRKFLVELSMPLGLLIVLNVLSIFKPKRLNSFLSLCIILFCSNGVVAEISSRFIEHPFRNEKLSIKKNISSIFVLDGHNNLVVRNISDNNNIVSNSSLAAFDLFQEKNAKKLVFFKSKLRKRYKFENYLVKEANKRKIDLSRIQIIDNVKTTRDEIIEIKNLIEKDNITEKMNNILITHAFHMRRSINTLEKVGIEIEGYPVGFLSNEEDLRSIFKNPMNWIPTSNSFNKSYIIFKELLAILIYQIL